MRQANEKTKKKMFCRHCIEDSRKCEKNPVDCMSDPEARNYFENYNHTGIAIKHDGLEGKYDVKTHSISI